jgi:hypothetical protein
LKIAKREIKASVADMFDKMDTILKRAIAPDGIIDTTQLFMFIELFNIYKKELSEREKPSLAKPAEPNIRKNLRDDPCFTIPQQDCYLCHSPYNLKTVWFKSEEGMDICDFCRINILKSLDGIKRASVAEIIDSLYKKAKIRMWTVDYLIEQIKTELSEVVFGA